MPKKWDVLFIKEQNSLFDSETPAFIELFNTVDKVLGKEEALEIFDANQYDIIIGDISVDPTGVGLLKQIKDKKPKQQIFALVSEKDTDKLFGVADMGINAFELNPSQFDQALQAISEMDPYDMKG